VLIDQGVAYGSLTAKWSGVEGPERLSVRGPALALGGPVGVTLTDRLSVTAHVDDVVGSCARQLCSRCFVRYCAVVVSKLTYAASAWWGFTTSADRQRIDTVLRRAVWSDLWTSSGKSDAHTFEDLCNSADDELFTKIRTSSNHILHALLPPLSTASQYYGLRQRVHSLQLPERSTHLSDCQVQ